MAHTAHVDAVASGHAFEVEEPELRIAYYNELMNYPTGGGSHARGLLRGLIEAGHEVRVLPVGTDSPTHARSAVTLGTSLPEPLKAHARDIRGRLKARKLLEGVLGEIDTFRPDCCIVRRPGYDHMLPHVLAALKCPVVAECNAVSAIEAALFHGQQVLRRERNDEKSFYRNADICAAVSEEVAQQLVGMGVEEGRIEVVPNGVDPTVFAPDIFPDPEVSVWARDFPFVVGYCAAVGPIHDLDTIVRAATILSDGPADIGFLFVGPTEDDLHLAGMPETVRRRSLAMGVIPHSRVPGALRTADLYWAALPTTHGSPLKTFEYLALGRPVVFATAGSGVGPILDARAGAVVQDGDAEGLAVEVLTRLSDRELAAVEGARGTSWVLNHATWRHVAMQITSAVEDRWAAGTFGPSRD